MKQLEARKVAWPMWDAYFVEQEKWCPHMYFSKQELLDNYSIWLLNILDIEWFYYSPTFDKSQLKLEF